MYAPRSRFIPDALLALFERRGRGGAEAPDSFDAAPAAPVNVKARLREMWK